jgi:hypothetical protein
MSATELKAPFPYFGGKSRVAEIVWQRLGDVRNYVEPFCGSAAMLLNRPHEPKIETLNDSNAFLANFWRAVKADPEAVAAYADWPVNETDLHARHRWLVNSDESRQSLALVKAEPEYFDAKVAGWWCWGACCWIGSGWCPLPEQLPHVSDSGQGVNRLPDQRPNMDASRGVIQSPLEVAGNRPQLCNGNTTHGNDVNGRPQLADQFSRGRGVHSNDAAANCDSRRLWLVEWFCRLADRLRPVRVCCGHWRRICDSPSTTTRLGLTGVFLDPPYRKTVDGKQNRHGDLYANDSLQCVDSLCDEVQEWCLQWQDVPEMRIALCGLEGEYPKLDHWVCVPWKAVGGYGNQSGEVNDNAARERIWFSPRCIEPVRERTLFDALEPA